MLHLTLIFLAYSVYSIPPNEVLKSIIEHLLNRPIQPTHQFEQLIDNDELTRQIIDNGLIRFTDSKSAVAKLNSDDVTFLSFKEILSSNGWKLSSNGKIVMPSGFKIIDEYIVPDAWKSSLPPEFYLSEHGDILPKGYAVKSNVVVPEDYVVTNKAIMPKGWKDGGVNAFAVPEDWMVDSWTGRAYPPLSSGGLFNEGFPKSWKEESSKRKWIAPQFYFDEKMHKSVPKGIRYIQGSFSRLSFPEDLFKEIESPHGKVLIPTVLKYEHGKIVPPGFKVTMHGRVIPSTWFEDVETGVVAPPGLDLVYFGKDIRLKLSYLGKLDRLAPDGKGMLKAGYIKTEEGDIIPETWKVMPDRLYLPPSFKTSGLNILFERDNMDKYGNIYGPEYSVPIFSLNVRGFIWNPALEKGKSHKMKLPWGYRYPGSIWSNSFSALLHVPDTYSVVKERKMVYPKGDFVYKEIFGTLHNKELHWINTGPKTVLVPNDEYSFIPNDEQLRAIV